MPRSFDPNIGKATRWVKGQQSPNPGGRPRAAVFSEACRIVLRENFPGDRKHRTFAEVIAERLAVAAARGNLKALAELVDRTEGKPRQALEVAQDTSERVTTGFEDMTEYELWAHLIELRLKVDQLIETLEWASGLAAPASAEDGQKVNTPLLS